MLRRVAFIVVAIIIAVLVYALHWFSRYFNRDYPCELNVESIAMCMQMYAADWDDHLPHPDHWVDQLSQGYYGGSTAVFKCPADKSGARSSYGMNRALAGLRVTEIANYDELVSIYETAHPGDNPSGGPDDVADPPRHPRSTYPSPRWYEGNMYGFVSGKLYPNEGDLPDGPTFVPELFPGDPAAAGSQQYTDECR